MIRVPGQTKPGSTNNRLVELIDLFPTLAECCQVEPPSEFQGRSLVPMFFDPAVGGKELACTVVTRGKDLGKAIRNARYHYTMDDSPRHAETLDLMRYKLTRAESRAIARQS